ncbi:putative alpha-1-antitrypsin-related protein [Sciurus carolinensis]|uniref:putative alpha-1-antitrypsin-related protein n=1 Tax=Sciurus carolinensis TaxID=30640 RepID=UPI001FB32B80|nr:putative alpha-1-antitrypsin-related protein [Sciurus carolinensis]
MPSCSSWGLLLLAGLCCLAPGFQMAELQEIDSSDHGHQHQEPLPCHNFSADIIDLAFTLYREPATWSRHTNILFSPVSIAMAFAMLSMGTKGDTHTQILEGLKLKSRGTPEAQIHECFRHLLLVFQQPGKRRQLTMNSSLFIQRRLKLLDKFLQDSRNLYHSDIVPVNFKNIKGAKKQINSHMEQKTQRKVKGLVKDLKNGTTLALVNYISFHARWNEEAEAERHITEDFHVNKKTTVKVPMINCLGNFFLHRDKELSSWVLVQHYLGDATAFAILPDPGKMEQVEKKLTQRHFEDILSAIDLRSVNLHFPKLSISGTYDLRILLSRLGITKVFSNGADLSGITEKAPLSLSQALHKAVLTLDKKEIVTSGATKWEDNALSKAPTLQFNRPFLLIVKDEYTNFPLFGAKVVNPIQK